MKNKKPQQVICDYCNNPAKLVKGAQIWPHRKDLAKKNVYSCEPCEAHVGCHPGTRNPLGRLAKAELRKAKVEAHAAFDPLWRRGPLTRPQAYIWLSRALEIPFKETHIGYFDEDQCRRVVELCEQLKKELSEAKEALPPRTKFENVEIGDVMVHDRPRQKDFGHVFVTIVETSPSRIFTVPAENSSAAPTAWDRETGREVGVAGVSPRTLYFKSDVFEESVP